MQNPSPHEPPPRSHSTRITEVSMSTNTILIIVVLVLLFGGGGFFFSRRR
jgi:LPXTG-motif cell wall-anchored protein